MKNYTENELNTLKEMFEEETKGQSFETEEAKNAAFENFVAEYETGNSNSETTAPDAKIPVVNNGEEAEPESDDTTKEGDDSAPKRKNALRQNQIYKLSDLMVWGYTLAFLSINRAIADRVVSVKKKSIKTHGIICPCIVVSARECLEDGMAVRLEDGTEVNTDTPNLDKIYVIIDGQHRHEAVRLINGKAKTDEDKKECFYCLPMTPISENYTIIDVLRESNVATAPWKGGDYLTNLLLTAKEGDEVDLKMLRWVQKKFETCGDTAAWLWATLDKSRVYSKSTIIKATQKAEVLSEVADTRDFEMGKAIFEAVESCLGKDMVKLKVLPLWVIKKIKVLGDIAVKKDIQAILTKFFTEEHIPSEQKEEITKFKKDDDYSKDAKIEMRLDELWQAASDELLKPYVKQA